MKILLADDHDLVRDTIAMYLSSEGAAEVVVASDVSAAIGFFDKSAEFDLVLLDYNMPGMNGLAGFRKIKSLVGDIVPVAILSGSASAAVARDALEAGASGFLPKTLAPNEMMSAVQQIARGGVFVPHEFLNKAQAKKFENLTERETDVLRRLCEGKSNKEIARDLDLQEVTIKLHVKTLCRKLDAKNRTQAAMIATSRNFG